MSTVTLTLEEAGEARAAATMAAEFARENAETHERYCADEYAAEDRGDGERFEALCARLDALIEIAETPGAANPDPAESRK